MAKGVPTTPAQSAEIFASWLSTGNFSETARLFGVSDHAVRLVVRRATESERGELHTLALSKIERDYRRALSENLPRLSAALQNAPTTKDLVEASKAMHDGLRTLSQVRTAHAKITGEHAAEKHELTGANGAPLTIYAPAEREP